MTTQIALLWDQTCKNRQRHAFFLRRLWWRLVLKRKRRETAAASLSLRRTARLHMWTPIKSRLKTRRERRENFNRDFIGVHICNRPRIHNVDAPAAPMEPHG